MNIEELFEKQKKLDDFIMGKFDARGIKTTEYDKLLSFRLLSFIVEVGEIVEATNREETLFEYIDALHFLLSIGNLIDIKIPYKSESFKKSYNFMVLNIGIEGLDVYQSILVSFSKLSNKTKCFKYWSIKRNVKVDLFDNYLDLFLNFIYLGHLLEFTDLEIETAYIKKNDINYRRQVESY